MELVNNVIVQVIIIFILMGVGFIFAKTGKLSEKGIKEITNLILTIVTPCVLINSYQQKIFSADLAKKLLIAVALSIISHIAAIIIGMIFFKKDDKEYGINIFCTSYSNCGFMAIPLLQATLGDNGVFFGSSYLAAFSILSWTHGIYIMSGDKKQISSKNIIKNPGVLGTVIALILFAANIKLPDILGDTIGYIADLNTPLAMIVLGTYLIHINIKDIIKDKNIYLCSFTRLIVAPIAVIAIAMFLPIDTSIKMAILIPAACPAPATSVLFATKFEKDSNYACKVVSVSTLLSVITIPLLIVIANILGI